MRPAIPRARAAPCICSARRRISTVATVSSARRCRSALVWLSPTAYRGNKSVSIAYFGDGAANQGQVYESFNMAELWKLPVIYVIENNRYAMGTSVSRSSAQTDFSKRGASFNIPGEQVDGMDVRAVKAAGDKATQWCREGQRALHSGNADLPLSRPFDVRSREVPDPRGSGQGSPRQRSDRAGEAAVAWPQGQRTGPEVDRRGGPRPSSTRRRISRSMRRSRTCPNFIPTFTDSARSQRKTKISPERPCRFKF